MNATQFTFIPRPPLALRRLCALAVACLLAGAAGAQNFQINTLTPNNAVVVDVNTIAGDDRGGIAVSGSQVFYSGDAATVRAGRAGLTGVTGLGVIREGLVADMRTETVYLLANGTTPITPHASGAAATITTLLALDGLTGATNGTVITLSSSITVPPASNNGAAGAFSGWGRIAIHNGTRVYSIAIPSGVVTDLGAQTVPTHNGSETWAYWGIAESIGGETYLAYVQDSSTVVRRRVSNGAVSTIATFSNLGDMASFTVVPALNRWYFHNENGGQFGSVAELVGYADATFTIPSEPPTISSQPAGLLIVNTEAAAFSVSAIGTDPLRYQWRKDGVAVANATNATFALASALTSDAGNYTVVITNNFGAVTSSVAVLTVEAITADLLKITSLKTNNFFVVDPLNYTGDDRGGLVVTDQKVFLRGDDSVGSFNLTNLSGGVRLGTNNGANTNFFFYDSMIGDLRSRKVYLLANGSTAIGVHGGTATTLIQIHGSNGVPVGSPISLSASIGLPDGQNAGGQYSGKVGLFSGWGRLVVHNGTNAFTIDPATGTVTDLGVMTTPVRSLPQPAESWAYWGVAEYYGGTVKLVYGRDAQAIVRSTVPGGAVEVIGTFANLHDLANLTVVPEMNRWYFHNESVNQFTNYGNYGAEVLGYADATFLFQSQTAITFAASPVTVLEDSGANSTPSFVTTIPGGTASYVVTNDNNALFSAQPALSVGGTLSFTPAANANGTAALGVTAFNSSSVIVGTGTFTITVTPVNDAPSINFASNVVVLEDAGSVSLAGFASTTTGPANESGQSITSVSVSSDNAGLFSAGPALSGGTLTFTPLLNANGSATVTVIAQDNGGTANGGVDKATNTFTITVTAVNDAPSLTFASNVVVLEDAGAVSLAAFSSFSPGPANESGQSLIGGSIANNNPALFSVQPAISPLTGALTFTPAGNSNGVATVTVIAQDSGGTANGGVDKTTNIFTITVTAVNDAPSFQLGFNVGVSTNLLISGWGDNGRHQTDVPADLTGVKAIAAGERFTLALKNDGTVVGWGDAPGSTVPPGLSGVTAIAAGWSHGLALLNNGTVVAWGSNGDGQSDVPAGLTDVVAIAGTFNGSIAVKSDGTVVYWGQSDFGLNLTSGLSNVKAAAGGYNAFGLRNDGTVVAWGNYNDDGELDIPAGLSGVTAIASSRLHTLALKNDGTVVAWGYNNAGQTNVPPGLTGVVGIAAGGYHSLALKSDGTVVAWGNNNRGQTVVPSGLVNVTTVVAGAGDSSFALYATYTTNGIAVNEDSGAFTLALAVTNIVAGPADESGQAVNFLVSNDNNALFLAQPAISAAGTLTFTPKANSNGTATVTVYAHDDGGTANGGVDTSAAQTFLITVTAVNDAPVISFASNVVVLEDAGSVSLAAFAAITPGPANESGQGITSVDVSNDNNGLFSTQPALTGGTLTFVPTANSNGVATVTVVVQDDGGTPGGGVDKTTNTFTITITPVNDAPSFILAAASLTVNEDSGAYAGGASFATGILAGPANESAQAVSFTVTNDVNALFLVQPAIAANGTLSFTPAVNAYGSATVTVIAHDDGGTANGGVDTSAAQTFIITVTAVNDPPVIGFASNVVVLEDSGTASLASFAAITTGPANESGQMLIGLSVDNDNPALFSAAPAFSGGTLSFTPAANAYGSATVTVIAQDDGGTAGGGMDKATNTFTITVTAVNDAPVITFASNVVVLEDAGAVSLGTFATITTGPANESGQSITNLSVSSDNPGLFAGQPALSGGTLTFTPAANANGVATVTVIAQDDGGTDNGGVNRATNTFTLTVTAVNDAPTFTLRPVNTQSSLLNNGSFETGDFTGWVTSDTANTTPSLAVRTNGANLGFFNASASDGTYSATHGFSGTGPGTISIAQDVILPPGGGATLSFTYRLAWNTFGGSATSDRTFRVTVQPAGGGAEQFSQTVFSAAPNTFGFQTTNTPVSVDLSAFAGQAIRVGFVADIPVGDAGNGAFQLDRVQLAATTPDFIVYENTGGSTTLNFATNIVAGPADESGQAVAFLVNNNNSGLFSSPPAIGVNGTLTFTPATDANGVATMTVYAQDNGGTLNGGVDTSVARTFTITVVPVNSAPRITPVTDVVVNEDSAAFSAGVTTITTGPADESSQSITNVVTGNDNNSLFSVQPAVSASGVLTFTPAANKNGSATVTFTAQDNGGTANGGVNQTTRTLTITVNSVNDAPSFALPAGTGIAQLTTVSTLAGSTAGLADGTGSAAKFNNPYAVAADSVGNVYVADYGNHLIRKITPAGVVTTLAGSTAGYADGTGAAAQFNQPFAVAVDGADNVFVGEYGNNRIRKITPGGVVTTPNYTNSAGAAFSFGLPVALTFDGAGNLYTVHSYSGILKITPNGLVTVLAGVAGYSVGYVDATGGAARFDNPLGLAADSVGNVYVSEYGNDINQSHIRKITPAGVVTTVAGSSWGFADGTGTAAQFFALWGVVVDPAGDLYVTDAGNNRIRKITAGGVVTTLSSTAGYVDGALSTAKFSNPLGLAMDRSGNVYVADAGNNRIRKIGSAVPSFELTVLEDSGLYTTNTFATSISPGPADESAQTVSFTVSNNNNPLFSSQPAIAADGRLTFTPAANAFGSATVTVTAVDSGSGTPPNVNTSAAQTFTITVTPVNDQPSVTLAGNVTRNEDSGAYSQSSFATFSAGNASESGQTVLAYTVNNNNSSLFSVQPAINTSGTLTFTPAANSNGVATVTVSVRDNGGTANGGVDTSDSVTFTITVNSVNDAPSFALNGGVLNTGSGGGGGSGDGLIVGGATYYPAGGAVVLVAPDLTYSNSVSSTTAGAAVSIDNGQTGDVLGFNSTLATSYGISGTYNSTTKVLSFTGSATTAQYQEVLRSVTYSNASGTPTTDRTISFNVGLNTLYNPLNGHFYEYISSGLSWTSAFSAATNRTFQGMRGYLATVTSQAENDFIKTKLLADAWIGASDDFNYINAAVGSTLYANQSASEGKWYWVTGPEAGQQILSSNNRAAVVGGRYNNFNSGEPNNAGSEQYAEFYTTGLWNDLPNATLPYVVEYGGQPGDVTSTLALSGFRTLTYNPVLQVTENSGLNTFSLAVTNISAGPADESAQLVDFIVSNNNGPLFTIPPAIAADGTLTFTLAANAFGSATVTVQAHDDGGTANGGVNTSAAKTFTIVVNNVNEAPTVTFSSATVTALEDSGLKTVSGFATVTSFGVNESSQTLLGHAVANNNNGLFSVQPAINNSGVLTFTPAANSNGVATVTVVSQDSGGTAYGGVDKTTNTFTITITPVNDAPSFALPAGSVGAAGATWTARESNRAWQAVASSADGSKLVAAVIGGQIYTSTDSGVNWTARASDRNWVSVASSADGSKLVAVVQGGAIYTSTDSGVTWTPRENDRVWRSVASSADGNKLVAVERNGGQIYTSTDSGVTWTVRESSRNWYSVASSTDGSKLVAVVYGGQIYTSTDSGVTWTPRENDRTWWSVASSADGSKLVAVERNGGQIYTSTDSGVTWRARASAGTGDWNSVASSADGSRLVAVVYGGQIYTSTDSGVTWTPRENGRTWWSVASSSDGSKLVAVVPFNQIYTSVGGAGAYALTVNEDSGAQTVANFATSISAGPTDESAQVVDFLVSNDNNALFSSQPVIAANGTLTFTSALNAFGTATVTVRAHDDGGTANSGVDTSAAQTFTITVTNVNDAPTVALSTNNVVTLEDSGANSVTGFASVTSFGPNESAQTLLGHVLTAANTALFSVQPAINNSGVLTFTPALNANGSTTVTVVSQDSGGTANGGVDKTTNTFTISITPVNDSPGFALNGGLLSVVGVGFDGSTRGYSVGTGGYGQLAAGVGVTSSSTPREIVNINDFTQVSAGDYQGMGLRADGTVWVWGRNDSGQLANGYALDDGSANSHSFVPLQVAGLANVIKVDAGYGWNMVLRADGTVWTWGGNNNGQLGLGYSGSPVLTPTQVPGLSGITTIVASGQKGLALKSDGTLWTWGENNNGMLGRGVQFVSEPTPAIVPSLGSTVARLFPAVGTHVFVELTDGTIWTWGDYYHGQQGNGTSGGNFDPVPSQVPALGAHQVLTMAAGQVTSFAVMNDGTVKAWGANYNGVELGLGSGSGIQSTPVTVPGLANIVSVSPNFSGLALSASGQVYAWGQSPIGTYATPTLVAGLSNITAISSGQGFFHALGNYSSTLIGIAVNEDSGPQTVTSLVTSISAGPADESSQVVDFLVSNNNNPLFSSQPAIAANGTLTFTPALNAFGTATVTVRAHDDGGTANGGVDTSAAQTFTIVVNNVNDAPTVSAPASFTVTEDVAGDLLYTGTPFADIDSTTLTVTLSVTDGTITGNAGTGITVGGTATARTFAGTISALNAYFTTAGKITYQGALNNNAARTLTTSVSDGSDTSSATSAINITPVNDAPSFALPAGSGGGGAGTVTTLAGTAGSSGNTDGIGSAARFNFPWGMARDSAGTLYVADQNNSLVRKLTPAGVVTTFTSTHFLPAGLAVDSADNVYVSELGGVIRKITPAGVVTILAGTPFASGSADGTGGAASFDHPYGLAVDAAGTLYVADSFNHTIRKVTSAGVVTTLAGSAGNSGAVDGTGSGARFNQPLGLAVDGAGNVYVADEFNRAIRKVTPAGVVTTLAGNLGVIGFADGTGAGASFFDPTAIVLDSAGDLYVTDKHTVRKVTTAGVVTTIAGVYNQQGSTDATGTDARFNTPYGLTTDNAGSLYVADTLNATIRRVQLGTVVTPYTLTVLEDSGAYAGGAGFATSISAGPPDEVAQVVDFLVSNDNNSLFGSQPAIAANGTLTFTPAANAFGTATVTVRAHDDGGTANSGVDTSAAQTFTITVTSVNDAPSLASPINVTGTEDTTLAFTAANFTAAYQDVENTPLASITIVTLPATGALKLSGVNVTAGQVIPAANLGNLSYMPAANDNVVATGYQTFTVTASDGGLSSASATVRMAISPVNDAPSFALPAGGGLAGTVTTFAGTAGVVGSDDGTGPAAQFGSVYGVAVDAAGNVYVPDSQYHTLRKITPAGVVTTLAGSPGLSGTNDGTGSAARFYSPTDAAVDSAGNIYVTDQTYSIIRKVTPAGEVTTLAGSATYGSADGTGAAASFYGPHGIAVDPAGNNIYVADTVNRTIRKVTAAGVVTTLAGLAGNVGTSDGVGAAAQFDLPTHLALDSHGDLYVSDRGVLRKVSTGDGTVTTITPAPALAGLALGVAVDSADNVFVIIENRHVIQQISPAGVVTTIAGVVLSSGSADGVGSDARFNYPYAMALDNAGNLYVADTANYTIRKVVTGTVSASATVAVLEDSGAYTGGANFATSISAGPADESGQVVSFVVTNDNTALFSSQPAIAVDGTLTFTPAANAFGSATVTVIAQDDGGTANGGVDTSAAQTFTITVTPVNDAPSFTLAGTNLTVFPGDGAVTRSGWAAGISTGPGNESGQHASFTVSVPPADSAKFTVPPAIAADGTLTFTPVLGATGVVTVGVSAQDNGGMANGGVDTSTGRYFTISLAAAKVFVSDSPTAAASDGVSVPVSLAGLGAEGGVGFTLTFDPALLSFNSVSAPAGVALLAQASQAGSGRIGIAVSRPVGSAFPAGTNLLITVSFTTAAITTNAVTPITYSDVIAVQQVADTSAGIITPVLWVPGQVTITAGTHTVGTLEGDVAPRPGGNGNVTVADAIQIGRYAAGLDTITSFGPNSEFQRADCAPLGTKGDGAVTVADWVQALRFAAGMDTPGGAGGPEGTGPMLLGLRATSLKLPAGLRTVRVAGGNLVAGRENAVSVQMDAQGNEAGVQFSLSFDSSVLTFVRATLGSGAAGGSLMANKDKAAAGKLGLVLVMPAGTSLAAGTQDIITLSFNVTGSGSTAITVVADSQATPREVADVTASVLGANYVDGSFNIILPAGLKAAGLERAADGSLRLVVRNSDGSAVTAAQAAKYQVYVTANLGGAWTLLPNALVLENGALKIVDPAASGAGLRLYKLVETP